MKTRQKTVTERYFELTWEELSDLRADISGSQFGLENTAVLQGSACTDGPKRAGVLANTIRRIDMMMFPGIPH